MSRDPQRRPSTVVSFNCELCGAICGMRATVEGERIAKVTADRDHPASRGYSCVKGRAIAERHHGVDRLDRPSMRGKEVSWELLLDDLATRLQGVLDDGGANSVGLFHGQGAVFDKAGLHSALRLKNALGTRQHYSASTLDGAPLFRAAELVTGFATNPPVWSPDEAPTLAVLIGVNPPISSGYTGSCGSNWLQRLRGFRRRGGELWVIDPRQTKTARAADRHLAPRPGTDVFLLGWLVRELLEDGFDEAELAAACDPADVQRLRAGVAPFELAAVAERTGLAGSHLMELLAAVRRHGQVALVPGTGVSFQPTGVLVYWLIWAVEIITGSLDREGGLKFLPPSRAVLEGAPLEGHAPAEGSYTPGPVSRADLDGFLGQLPAVALSDEIESGQLRGLIVFGANPLASVPNPDRLRAALAQLEVLAVVDVFENDLTELATHTIPVTWFTERSSFIFFPQYGIPRVYASPAVVVPGAERRHAWWVFAQLGRLLGIDLLDGLDPDTAADETVIRQVAHASCDYADLALEAGPAGVTPPFRHGWFHEKVLPRGRWRLAPSVLVERLADVWDHEVGGLRLVSGRIIEKVNSASYTRESGEPPPIYVSADAAGAQGIRSGDRVRVSTAFGTIEGLAEVDATLAGQSIWVNHGWAEQNVNRIIDPTPDRLTAQPFFTGVSVRLERVNARDVDPPVAAA